MDFRVWGLGLGGARSVFKFFLRCGSALVWLGSVWLGLARFCSPLRSVFVFSLVRLGFGPGFGTAWPWRGCAMWLGLVEWRHHNRRDIDIDMCLSSVLMHCTYLQYTHVHLQTAKVHACLCLCLCDVSTIPMDQVKPSQNRASPRAKPSQAKRQAAPKESQAFRQ